MQGLIHNELGKRLLHLIFFLQVKKFILACMYMEGTALPLLARKMCLNPTTSVLHHVGTEHNHRQVYCPP